MALGLVLEAVGHVTNNMGPLGPSAWGQGPKTTSKKLH